MSNRLLGTIALVLVSVTAVAGERTLRGIMQDLGAQFGRLGHAIMADDLATVETEARAIAEHPRPSMGERARILSRVGTDAGRFRHADAEVHGAALAVAEAAAAGDQRSLIEGYHRLVDACLACHTNFRDRLREPAAEETQSP